MPEGEWGVDNRVLSAVGPWSRCLGGGEATGGVKQGWSTPSSWSNSHILVSVQLFSTMKEITFFSICIVKYITINSMYFASTGLGVPSKKDYSL